MTHDNTTLDTPSVARTDKSGIPIVEALIVVWSADDPSRVGEALLLPEEGDRRGSFVFGRGTRSDGRRERVRLVRQRPGEIAEAPPLETPHLSRSQLVLRRHPEGGITIENEGKRALLVDGKQASSARVRPGQTVEVRDQLVFLCASRPSRFPALRVDDARLRPAFGEPDAFGYVGESAPAWSLRDEVAAVARRASTHVLVLGESGVGKELVAQAVHAMSERSGRKLVARNAATVPAGIIDAELFGNAPGYPNAGMPERVGLVGEAEGGTLYLDEIGELPLELQTHLLRLLDSGDYQRLGDARRRTADVRIVAATNRPIEQLRSDLAARFPIRVRAPDLHARREDVPLVARCLLRRIVAEDPASSRRLAGASPTLSRELTLALVRHFYATHVRELVNVLYRAALESQGPEVDLTPGAREMLGPSAGSPAVPASEVTRETILEALERNGGVRERVWRELGLANRYVLKRLMRKYGIAGDDDEA
jgi:DNA-binding NtrC family response regulator